MIKMIAGGKAHKYWVADGIAQYEKRLRQGFKLDWSFVAEEKIEGNLKDYGDDYFVILLDEHGKQLPSPDFAQCLQQQFLHGKKIICVIGGAYGHFPPLVKERADLVLSLSKMVLPHELCRLLLVEQIYRAQEIIEGGKYHHA